MDVVTTVALALSARAVGAFAPASRRASSVTARQVEIAIDTDASAELSPYAAQIESEVVKRFGSAETARVREAWRLMDLEHVYEEAIIDGMYEQVRVKPNKALHRSARFLFTTAVLFSIALMCLAPLYFVSRDVYEDDDAAEGLAEAATGAAGSLRQAAATSASGPRNRHISAYNPIPGPDRSQGADDERQYLGRASLPMRPMKNGNEFTQIEGV